MAITFRKKIGGWTLMTQNLKPQLPNLPDLAAQHADLEKTIADAQALVNEQEDLRGRLQKIVHQRQTLEKQGEDQRHRLSAALQSKMGFTDESLMTYGVAPKKKRVRRKKKTTAGQTTQPGTPTGTIPPSPNSTGPAASGAHLEVIPGSRQEANQGGRKGPLSCAFQTTWNACHGFLSFPTSRLRCPRPGSAGKPFSTAAERFF